MAYARRVNPVLRFVLIALVIAAVVAFFVYRRRASRTPEQVARAEARAARRRESRIAALPLEVRPSKWILYIGWFFVLGGFLASISAFVNWRLNDNRLPFQLAFALVVLLGVLILAFYWFTSTDVRGDVLVQRRLLSRARVVPLSSITSRELVERAGHSIVHLDVAGQKPLVVNLTGSPKLAEWKRVLGV